MRRRAVIAHPYTHYTAYLAHALARPHYHHCRTAKGCHMVLRIHLQPRQTNHPNFDEAILPACGEAEGTRLELAIPALRMDHIQPEEGVGLGRIRCACSATAKRAFHKAALCHRRGDSQCQ
jgi:hypothetical protein